MAAANSCFGEAAQQGTMLWASTSSKPHSHPAMAADSMSAFCRKVDGGWVCPSILSGTGGLRGIAFQKKKDALPSAAP